MEIAISHFGRVTSKRFKTLKTTRVLVCQSCLSRVGYIFASIIWTFYYSIFKSFADLGSSDIGSEVGRLAFYLGKLQIYKL